MSDEILRCLSRVEHERQRRLHIPGLQRKVERVKRYQQRRFAATYRDLAAQQRYREAFNFFLDELYGPADFQQRDHEFGRIVPKIEVLFPTEVRATVLELARLHALSEELDTEMALALDAAPLDPKVYTRIWNTIGRRADRAQQIDSVLVLGRALDRHTRHRWLLRTLRLMRRPARAAGLSALQAFLERGTASFQGMGGAAEFLDIVEARETALMNTLFLAAADGASPELPQAIELEGELEGDTPLAAGDRLLPTGPVR